tara:strand:- start:2468 stop:2815 length:348 start_codon:yes stop_codon:yes gene_type:complete
MDDEPLNRWCGNSERLPICMEGSEKSLFDGWSLIHLMVGAVFTGCLLFIKAEWWVALILCFVFAVLWEVFENTKIGIYCQRIFTKEYNGDNIRNSVADVFCNMCGGALVVLYKFK